MINIKKLALTCFFLALFLFCASGLSAAEWYSSNWNYRKSITLLSAKVSNTNQNNFPVLINSTDADWRYVSNGGGVGKGNGDDIVFTSSDGVTKLDHEISTYTPTTGKLIAWVRVSTISASVNVPIYIYYGNQNASAQSNITGVWRNGYAGVWHLDEVTGGNRVDSSSSTNNLTDTNTVGVVTGPISNCAVFFSSNSEKLERLDASVVSLKITGKLTLSAWIQPYDTGVTQGFLTKSGSSGNAGYLLRVSNTRYTFILSNDGTASTTVNSTQTYTTGGFHYVTAVYDGSFMRVYVDGVESTNTAYSAGIFNNTTAFDVGTRSSQYFDGAIDEARVSFVDRSADWIKTEYNNQVSPSTFYTLGTEEMDTSNDFFLDPD